MKKYIISILFASLVLASSYAKPEAPEFVRTKNWKLEEIGRKQLLLSAVAVYYNPNKVKAKLKDLHLDIWLGETYAGEVDLPEEKVKIRKKSAFEIPLIIRVAPDTNAWGYLSGLLSAVTFQDTVVSIKGKIKFRALGIMLRVKVDEQEDINLKDLI